jgi:hypothetical protein
VKKLGPNASLGSSITTIDMQDGTPSGGTLDTILSAFDLPAARIKDVQTDMYSLTPSEPQISYGVHNRDLLSFCLVKGTPRPRHFVKKIPFSSVYGSFGFMAAINERVVNRTWGLFEARAKSTSQVYPAEEEEDHTFRYGPEFHYEEYSEWNNRLTGSLFAVVFLAAMAAITWLPPFRWFLKFIGPKVGTGPKARSVELSPMSPRTIIDLIPQAGGPTYFHQYHFDGRTES